MSDTPVSLSTLRTDENAPIENLTDWANPPSLRDLQADLESARQLTDEHIANVATYRKNLAGEFTRKKRRPGRSTVQPKTIRGQAEWRYSSLSEAILAVPDIFQATPRTYEDALAARQHATLLNFQFQKQLHQVPLVDELVRTLTDTGTAALRVGWHQVVDVVKEEVPVYSFYPITTQEEMDQLSQALQAADADPSQLEQMTPEMREAVQYFRDTQQPTIAVQSGTQIQDVQKVVVNKPTVDVIDSRNLYVDPTCKGKWWNARFMVYTFESSYAEMKEDSRYKNLDAVSWESIETTTNMGPQNPTPTNMNFKDKLRRRVPVREWYGLRDINNDGKLVPILVVWVGGVIVRAELNPFPDKMAPFVIIPFMPVTDSAFGEPDGKLLADNQRIIGAVTRGMIDLMGRSANGQTGTAKQFLDTPNRMKYDAGEDYEFNPNMNPQQHVYTHKFPEIPASAFNMLNHFTLDGEAQTGVKAFHQGLSSASYGDVAAGTRGVMSAAAQRESSIMRRIKFGLSLVGQKIAEMNKVFLSDEEVVRVTNEGNIAIRREDLQGGVDITVNITSQAENDARASELSFMLQAAGNVDQGLRNMILAEIADLRRMPEFAQRVRNYQPQPDPMQQKLQELEVARLESEIAVNQARVAALQGDARLKSATADKKDLEFVEDQTGVNHARGLEQSAAQARANQKLEVTKSLAKIGEQTGDLGPALLHAELAE